MKRILSILRSRWLARALAGAFACSTLSGCLFAFNDTGGGGTSVSTMSKDEQLLREQTEGFVEENVFQGALLGAGVGCAIGALASVLGDGRNSVLEDCLVAGAIGGFLGGADGYFNAKSAQHKSNRVQKSRAIAADARRENERLEELLATTERVVDENERRLADLRTKVDSKQMSLDQARTEARVVRQNSRQIATAAEQARKSRDHWVNTRSRLRREGVSDTADLDREIARLEQQIARLESEAEQLDASLGVTRLG